MQSRENITFYYYFFFAPLTSGVVLSQVEGPESVFLSVSLGVGLSASVGGCRTDSHFLRNLLTARGKSQENLDFSCKHYK